MIKKRSVIFSDSRDKDNAPSPQQGQAQSQETRDQIITRTKATDKLDSMVERSSRVILKVRAVFPFNLFPDEVVIDETKITIYIKIFFWTKQTITVMYEDIFNVIVEQSVLFATLEIADRFFSQTPIQIRYLTRQDAQKARRIIQGMVVIAKEKIKTESLPLDELRSKVEKIGETE